MTDTRTNGQTPEELSVETAVLHHVASYQRVVNERDALQKQVDRQEQMLTVAKIEIEGLRSEHAATVTRMESYQAERDQAVADRAEYAVRLDMLRKILEKPPETLG